jgi:[ribosomal protein S5]-alanine N-acetyltransferase
MRTIRATLCTLEPQLAAHAEAMFEVLRDPAIYEFENAPPRSLEWLSERFTKLESRTSTDMTERWLNWVIRLPVGELAGYVQATVQQTGIAYVAYELASSFWRRGIGSCAVQAMLDELASEYRVHTFLAVLKARNYRSVALLHRLGFAPLNPESAATPNVEADEIIMQRAAGADTA